MRELRSAEELYGRLGVDPGQGPFKIKGTGYVFHHAWVQQFLPGGNEAQLVALGALGQHDFFKQTFFAGTMYDVFPLVALGYACSAVRRQTLSEFVRMRARYQAEQDLRHIRKWLVKMASPTMVAKRFPSILTSYFDFGTPETEDVEAGLRGLVRGVPEILAPWMIATCRGFAEHALEVNGASEIKVESQVTSRKDPERGFAMSDLRFDFRWRA